MKWIYNIFLLWLGLLIMPVSCSRPPSDEIDPVKAAEQKKLDEAQANTEERRKKLSTEIDKDQNLSDSQKKQLKTDLNALMEESDRLWVEQNKREVEYNRLTHEHDKIARTLSPKQVDSEFPGWQAEIDRFADEKEPLRIEYNRLWKEQDELTKKTTRTAEDYSRLTRLWQDLNNLLKKRTDIWKKYNVLWEKRIQRVKKLQKS